MTSGDAVFSNGGAAGLVIENVSHRKVMSMIWPSDRPSPVLGCVEVVVSPFVGTSIPSESSSKIYSAQEYQCICGRCSDACGGWACVFHN